MSATIEKPASKPKRQETKATNSAVQNAALAAMLRSKAEALLLREQLLEQIAGRNQEISPGAFVTIAEWVMLSESPRIHTRHDLAKELARVRRANELRAEFSREAIKAAKKHRDEARQAAAAARGHAEDFRDGDKAELLPQLLKLQREIDALETAAADADAAFTRTRDKYQTLLHLAPAELRDHAETCGGGNEVAQLRRQLDQTRGQLRAGEIEQKNLQRAVSGVDGDRLQNNPHVPLEFTTTPPGGRFNLVDTAACSARIAELTNEIMPALREEVRELCDEIEAVVDGLRDNACETLHEWAAGTLTTEALLGE
ncbi:hypothetical protein OAS39_00660 [Pirellulales bacterium]|nr:hypothetical protein [Pirellulales bacterium]